MIFEYTFSDRIYTKTNHVSSEYLKLYKNKIKQTTTKSKNRLDSNYNSTGTKL